MATQDDYIRTALRVPPELHAKIHESAKQNNRTFNAEIVARLEGSFEHPTEKSSAQEELLSALKAQVMLSRAGLQLTNAAVGFLALELPEIRDAQAFPMLKETLAAGLKAAPAEIDPLTDEAFESASTAVESYKNTAEKLRKIKLIHSVRRTLKEVSDMQKNNNEIS